MRLSGPLFYGVLPSQMSQRVVKTIYSADRQRKVEIVERRDGAFTFDVWQFSHEPREMCWLLFGHKGFTLTDTAERAETEARSRFGWLEGQSTTP